MPPVFLAQIDEDRVALPASRSCLCGIGALKGLFFDVRRRPENGPVRNELRLESKLLVEQCGQKMDIVSSAPSRLAGAPYAGRDSSVSYINPLGRGVPRTG